MQTSSSLDSCKELVSSASSSSSFAATSVSFSSSFASPATPSLVPPKATWHSWPLSSTSVQFSSAAMMCTGNSTLSPSRMVSVTLLLLFTVCSLTACSNEHTASPATVASL